MKLTPLWTLAATLAVALAWAAGARADDVAPSWGEPRQLTHGIIVNNVQYLPDGRLLFATDDGVSIISENGGGERQLFARKDVARANMQRGGNLIVMDDGRDITITDAAGLTFTALAGDPDLLEFAVSFTPDGENITFVTIDPVNGAYTIGTMAPDGTNKQIVRASDTLRFRHPRTSPDGLRMSFFAVGAGQPPRIYVMDRSGGNLTQLTQPDRDGPARQASWSADGRRFVFTLREGGGFNIWTMNTDGSGKARVTHIGGDEAKPVWSPDGTSIAFICSDCKGEVGSDLYVISRR